MLAEYKKENTSKELQRLADDVNRKKKQAKTYETQAKSRLEELKQFDSIGFTKEEVWNQFEMCHEKTCFLHIRKSMHRSAPW